jgi:hypothetical protein
MERRVLHAVYLIEVDRRGIPPNWEQPFRAVRAPTLDSNCVCNALRVVVRKRVRTGADEG